MELSTSLEILPIPQKGADISCKYHIMLSFTNTLVGIGLICDAICKFVFMEHDMTVYSPAGEAILTGWLEK